MNPCECAEGLLNFLQKGCWKALKSSDNSALIYRKNKLVAIVYGNHLITLDQTFKLTLDIALECYDRLRVFRVRPSEVANFAFAA